MKIVDKVFGTHSERELKLINPIVDKVEALRPKMQELSDEEFKLALDKAFAEANMYEDSDSSIKAASESAYDKLMAYEDSLK